MYKVDYIENVPEMDRIPIISREMGKQKYVGHHEYPETQGFWTLVFVYRR